MLTELENKFKSINRTSSMYIGKNDLYYNENKQMLLANGYTLNNTDVYMLLENPVEIDITTDIKIIENEKEYNDFMNVLSSAYNDVIENADENVYADAVTECYYNAVKNTMNSKEHIHIIVYDNNIPVSVATLNYVNGLGGITCIFLNCSLRLSELTSINLSDLKLDDSEQTLRVHGKGNKERTGYINEITKKALEEYLRIRDNFHPKNKTLFVSKYGLKMSSTGIEKIIKKAYKLAEIDDEDYCVHTLRHTCATLLYRNGIDIRTIQELLGHVQIDTTEIYTHLHDQEVMDAMLDHPLSQFKMAN